MENRDRDKVSRNDKSTDAGEINREVASRRGKEESGSDIEFGEKIGESENLEPGSRSSVDISGRSEGNH